MFFQFLLNCFFKIKSSFYFFFLNRVTKEHRTKLAKNAKTLTDNSKKTIRNIYSKYSKKIRNVKEGHSKDHIKAADDMVTFETFYYFFHIYSLSQRYLLLHNVFYRISLLLFFS